MEAIFQEKRIVDGLTQHEQNALDGWHEGNRGYLTHRLYPWSRHDEYYTDTQTCGCHVDWDCMCFEDAYEDETTAEELDAKQKYYHGLNISKKRYEARATAARTAYWMERHDTFNNIIWEA